MLIYAPNGANNVIAALTVPLVYICGMAADITGREQMTRLPRFLFFPPSPFLIDLLGVTSSFQTGGRLRVVAASPLFSCVRLMTSKNAFRLGQSPWGLGWKFLFFIPREIVFPFPDANSALISDAFFSQDRKRGCHKNRDTESENHCHILPFRLLCL